MENALTINLIHILTRNEIIKFILDSFDIKRIEYDKNYQWNTTSKKGVYLIESNYIQFKLKKDFNIDDYISIKLDMENNIYTLSTGSLDDTSASILIKNIESNYLQNIYSGNNNNYIDLGLQNTDEVKYWKVFERAIPSYVEILPNPKYVEGAPGMDMIEKEYINLESLPGHSHGMGYNEKLWFGASWQMYFSPVYYKYIPKPLWDDFTDCYEHKVFENGLRKITLFENPEDYDLSESRSKQWAFRRQLGIDSIAHEVCPRLNRQQFEPENLPVVITKKNCQKGQTRVTRFLDANKKLINSDKAVFKEVKEYLDDGITIVFEEITELKKGFFRNLFARE